MNFHFLVYVSRSGSTFLARQLSNRSAEILVMPEFNWPIWLLEIGDLATRSLNSNEILDLMKSDYQLANLDLSNQDLSEIVENGRDKGIKGLLAITAKKYATMTLRHDVSCVILKKGEYLKHRKQLLRLFPESKFIHVIRDPRATVNSRIHNHRPHFPQERMGRGDPLYCAREWKNYVATAHSVTDSRPDKS
jgi:hypothetical protein